MRRTFRTFFGLCAAWALAGCLSEANVESLASTYFNGPSFSGKSTHKVFVSSPAQSLTIAGNCNYLMSNAIEWSLDGGNTWELISGSSFIGEHDVDCEDKAFSFHINDISMLFSFETIGQTEVIRLRANMLAGPTAAATLNVTYGSSGSGPIALLSDVPTGVTNQTALNVTVNGTNVAEYMYKLGAADETECVDPIGYSGVISSSVPISDDIWGTDDGDIELCVVGGDGFGQWQFVAEPTVAVWTKDTSPPSNATSIVRMSPVNSPSVADSVTFEVGTVFSGDLVELYTDAGCTNFFASTYASGSSASLTINGLADGTYIVRARITDPAGNASDCSTVSSSYTRDSTPPDVPTNLTVLSPGPIGNDPSPMLRVFGVSAGDDISIYSDSSCTTLLAQQSAGGSTVDITLPNLVTNGAYTFYATAQDSIPNVSECSSAFASYTLDTDVPAPPSAVTLSNPLISPASNPMPSFMVSGVSAGEMVRIYSDATCTNVIGMGTSGGASVLVVVSSPLSHGTYTIYADTTDAASNRSACSSVFASYDLDLEASNAPSGLAFNTPSGSPGRINTPIIQINGVVENDLVELHINAICSSLVGSAVVATGTNVLVTSVALTQGSYNFYARAIDPVGNASPCTGSGLFYELDLTAPNTPSGLSLHSPGVSPGNDDSPEIMVSGVASGDIVRLYSDSNCMTEVGVNTSAGATVAVPVSSSLDEGAHVFYARSSDLAGNESTCSTANVSYELDLTPPGPPSAITLTNPASSPSNVDNPELLVDGLEIGDTLRIYNGAGCVQLLETLNVTQSPQPVVLSSLTDGIYEFHVEISDPAGNPSTCSAVSVSYELDTEVPSNITNIEYVMPATTPGNDSTPTFEVFGVSVGDLVELFVDPSCMTMVASGAAVGPSLPLTTSALSEGDYVFYARSSDAAGNATACLGPFISYRYDGNHPTVSISPDSGSHPEFPIPLTITFDEDVTGFNVSDITVSHGTISDFAVVDGRTFTANLRPSYYGEVTVSIGAGVLTDMAGNPNLVGASANLISTYVYPVAVHEVYPANSKWNDYILNNGSKFYNATGMPCSGSESGFYETCLHSGEIRRVEAFGQSSCANLDLDEALGAFEWVCDDNGPHAVFYSRGLLPGKGLRDLVEMSGWKPNFVTIKLNGDAIAQSPSENWWPNNSVMPLPSNVGGIIAQLNVPSAIYVAPTSQATRGYMLAADKVGVVTLGSAELFWDNGSVNNCNYYEGASSGNDTRAFFCFNGRRFVWIEANMNGEGGANDAYVGISMISVRFSRVQNTVIRNVGTIPHVDHAIVASGSRSNLFKNVVVDGCGGGALELEASLNNTFASFHAGRSNKNGEYAMIYAWSGSSDNRFYDLRITGDRSTNSSVVGGVDLEGNNNVFSGGVIGNLYSGSAESNGFYFYPGSSGNIVTGFTITASQGSAIFLAGASNNIFSHITLANHVYSGIWLGTDSGTVENNTVNSAAIVNTESGIDTYTSTGGNPNYVYNIASAQNANYAVRNGVALSGKIVPVGYVLTNQDCSGFGLNTNCGGFRFAITGLGDAFVGGVMTADSVNGSNINGTQIFSLITDWLHFENPFRLWGKMLTTFASSPGSTHQGACGGSMNCQIGDWRVRLNSVLHNRSGTGVAPNSNFIANALCPMEVSGNMTISAPGRNFLKNAIEINSDTLGNNNGLCESNEACIYAPNIGAYQGEGNYEAGGTCIFQNGTVYDVIMYSHPVTGI